VPPKGTSSGGCDPAMDVTSCSKRPSFFGRLRASISTGATRIHGIRFNLTEARQVDKEGNDVSPAPPALNIIVQTAVAPIAESEDE
jgi:hypothetical protein